MHPTRTSAPFSIARLPVMILKDAGIFADWHIAPKPSTCCVTLGLACSWLVRAKMDPELDIRQLRTFFVRGLFVQDEFVKSTQAGPRACTRFVRGQRLYTICTGCNLHLRKTRKTLPFFGDHHEYKSCTGYGLYKICTCLNLYEVCCSVQICTRQLV